MFGDWKVIAVTPMGRERYGRLLCEHVQRARPIVDEHHLWINPGNESDRTWLDRVLQSDPTFYHAVSSGISPTASDWEKYCSFYPRYSDDDAAIYIRFDDDILWMAPDAVVNLIRFRIANPDFFLVYANTINNGICSHLHQRMGLLPESPFLEYCSWGENSWRRWQTAAHAHDALLNAVTDENWSRFLFERWVFVEFDYCAINCICWWGRDWNAINEGIRRASDYNEERTLACDIPRALQRFNCIAGEALVSHHAYFTQRPELENQRPDIVDRYGDLLASATVNGQCDSAFEGRLKR